MAAFKHMTQTPNYSHQFGEGLEMASNPSSQREPQGSIQPAFLLAKKAEGVHFSHSKKDSGSCMKKSHVGRWM